MKYFWGLVLAGIGTLMLGVNLGWWSNNIWDAFWIIWPLIFIALGIRFLVDNEELFMILATIVVLTAGYLVVKNPTTVLHKIEGREDVISESFSDTYNASSTKKLKLGLDLGASNVLLDSISNDQLYKIETKNYGKLIKNKKEEGSETIISFDEEFTKGLFKTKLNKRELRGSLTETIPLELSLNSGASNLNLDFSKIKLENLKLDAGASKGEIKFGNLVDLNARIESGASKITILIPKGTGLKVIMDSDGLNTKDFASDLDLEKSDNTYKTKNYDTSTRKINLEISAGVSNISINQY